MPLQSRCRDRRAAGRAAPGQTRLRLQPAALDPRDLSDGARKDVPMVTRSALRLTLALLLCALPAAAWATGEFIQEIRFFSRSGMDPQSNLAFFHGRLGILRPTFDDNRLYAA